LYAKILGVTAPWKVVDVELREEEEEVEVFLEHGGKSLACPECGSSCPRYDHRRRSFRHLDTCQLKTMLTAEVPRVECDEHGVRQIAIPWAEPGSRFTAVFEAVAIDWLQEASIKAVARRLRCSWDELDGIKARAVARGLARRKQETLEHISVDETSFQKRHEYVTVVTDSGRDARVIHVADGRGQEALDDFFWSTELENVVSLKSVSMDMHAPFIAAVRDHVPEPDDKICFDRFHIAKHLGGCQESCRLKMVTLLWTPRFELCHRAWG
jgi:transposase